VTCCPHGGKGHQGGMPKVACEGRRARRAFLYRQLVSRLERGLLCSGMFLSSEIIYTSYNSTVDRLHRGPCHQFLQPYQITQDVLPDRSRQGISKPLPTWLSQYGYIIELRYQWERGRDHERINNILWTQDWREQSCCSTASISVITISSILDRSVSSSEPLIVSFGHIIRAIVRSSSRCRSGSVVPRGLIREAANSSADRVLPLGPNLFCCSMHSSFRRDNEKLRDG
jgi:hypothetical protein